MNNIKLLVQAQVSIFRSSTDVSSGIIQMEGDKYLIHTFELVKLFPIKIYRIFFRKDIYANQCNCLSKQFNKNVTERVMVITNLFDEENTNYT